MTLLKPSVLSLVLVVLIGAVVFGLGLEMCGSYAVDTESSTLTLTFLHGVPLADITSHVAAGRPPQRDVRIHGGPLAAALFSVYGLASLAAYPFRTRRLRVLPALLAVEAMALLLCLLGALLTSRLLWGYWFSRPLPDPRITSASAVLAVTPFTTDAPGGALELVPEAGVDLRQRLAAVRQDPYYSLDERALAVLDDRRVLPLDPPAWPAEKLAGWYARLAGTGRLVEGATGYNDATRLRGFLVEAALGRGTRLVFVAACGGQVSNDHYPFYEWLYAMGPAGEPRLLSTRRFFYDVAGIEGAEWPAFLLVYALPATAAVLIIGLPVLLWRSRRAKAREAGH